MVNSAKPSDVKVSQHQALVSLKCCALRDRGERAASKETL